MQAQTRTNLTAIAVIVVTVAVLMGAGYLWGRIDGRGTWKPPVDAAMAEARAAQGIAADAVKEAAYWRSEAADASRTAAALAEDIAAMEAVTATEDTPSVVPQSATPRTPHIARAHYVPPHRHRRAVTPGVWRWRALFRLFFWDRACCAMSVASGENRGGVPGLTSRTNDIGIMQINRCHLAHFRIWAKRKGLVPDLRNARSNIAYAAYMSKYGQDWSAWTVKP